MTPKKTISEAMTARVEKAGMDRRQFFITTAAVGGALVVGLGWPRRAEAVDVATPAAPWYREPSVPEINAWIVVAPDDTVTIRIGQTELGQGVWTACAMMIAEELQCDWSKVRGEYASANRDAREKAPEWTLKNPAGPKPAPTDPRGVADPATCRPPTSGSAGRRVSPHVDASERLGQDEPLLLPAGRRRGARTPAAGGRGTVGRSHVGAHREGQHHYPRRDRKNDAIRSGCGARRAAAASTSGDDQDQERSRVHLDGDGAP